MTYITKLTLNPERQQARRLLSNPHIVHASICKSFDEDKLGKSHPLWLIDTSRRDPTLFIVSDNEPDLTHIQETAGRTTSPQRTEPYTILEKLEPEEYLFKVKVNAVKRNRNKKTPLTDDRELTEWFLSRAENWGFQIAEDSNKNPQLQIPRKDSISFKKFDGTTKHTITQTFAIIQGKLQVIDKHIFKNTLTKGIGANRSLGCGLLLIEKQNPTEG